MKTHTIRIELCVFLGSWLIPIPLQQIKNARNYMRALIGITSFHYE